MNILCVMAHPDDEVLGAGGTLAKHAENGDTVDVAVMVVREGVNERTVHAIAALGIKPDSARSNYNAEGYPDQRLDTFALSGE